MKKAIVLSVVNKGLGGKNTLRGTDIAADNCVVARCFAVFSEYLKSLALKHQIQFYDPPAFKEIIRAIANSNNWVFLNFLCTQATWPSSKRTFCVSNQIVRHMRRDN